MFSLAVKHFIFAFKKSSGIPDLKQAGKKPVPNAGTMSDREEDVPECSGQEISRIYLGNIRFPGNAIWERRPLFETGVNQSCFIFVPCEKC